MGEGYTCPHVHRSYFPTVFGRRRRVSPRHGPDARRPKTVGENRYTPYRIGPESEGLSQGFGWPAGPSEAWLCALALSVATQEPRKAARVRMHPGQDPAIFAKHCSVLI